MPEIFEDVLYESPVNGIENDLCTFLNSFLIQLTESGEHGHLGPNAWAMIVSKENKNVTGIVTTRPLKMGDLHASVHQYNEKLALFLVRRDVLLIETFVVIH